MHFELLTTDTFNNQLFGLPYDQAKQVNAKVNKILREDPRPDTSKTKKKLEKYKENICRLRSGDYRVVYSYGDGWVKLLAVRNRKDVYEDEYFAEQPQIDLAQVIDHPEPAEAQSGSRTGHAAIAPIKQYLSSTIDESLLERLKVPAEFHAALMACKTEDDLLEVDVPPDIVDRVIDVVLQPDLAEVLAEPELIVQEEDDLVRFVEGDLLGFLLKLNPEQERMVDWGMKGAGPTLVKGGPGTGKSTIALYRVQAMIRALRAAGTRKPRVLFTTYTKALAHSSQQLLHRLLGDDARFVEVKTADSVVNGIFSYLGIHQNVRGDRELLPILHEAIQTVAGPGASTDSPTRVRALGPMSHDYLLEEINTVIEARELSSLDEYLAASRAGRRVPLGAKQRETVWRIYEAFGPLLDKKGITSWERLRRQAATVMRAGAGPDLYDGVVVDEVQDLDPTVLRLLVLLCKTPNRLFLAADANQSIYGSSFRWTDVHEDLRFRGRTEVLRINYRSTREIGEAAQSYLRNGALEDTAEERRYIVDGPAPAVRLVASTDEEVRLLARYFRQALGLFRLGHGSCAVLVPVNRTGQALAERLRDAGIEAVWMTGDDLDLEKPCVKIMNLRSAKGLEFPIVALAGFVENPQFGLLPDADPAEGEERLQRERRTLFVGMTRAMRLLLVAAPRDGATPLLDGFEEPLWNMKKVEALA